MNPSKVKKGKTIATEILATAGLAVTAYNLVKSPLGQHAVNLGKKFMEKAG
jgi:hypothetical protein